MFKITRKSRLVKVAAATAAIGSLAAIGFAGNSPANADPKQYQALIGVGSDTTQELVNAFAGFSSGQAFDSATVRSDAASGKRQIISFDATEPGAADPNVATCIITTVGGPAFERPNGSTAGRAAISRKIDGTKFEDKAKACGLGGVDVSSSVDFARSSSGPSGTSSPPNQLIYFSMGRDALSFGYYRSDGLTAVNSLTQTQLNTLFNGKGTASEVTNVGGVRILPCGIQLGSGTQSFWLTTSLKQTAAKETDAISTCSDLAIANSVGDANGRFQENNGDQLKEIGDIARAQNIADQVIIGFSASQYLAKTNGLGLPAPAAGVLLGAISNNGATVPVDCGAPIVAGAPNATFYNCANFGRSVFNVLPWAALYRDIDSVTAGIQEGPSFGNVDIKTIFASPSTVAGSICSKGTAINQFGFIFDAATCGTISRGPLLPNP